MAADSAVWWTGPHLCLLPGVAAWGNRRHEWDGPGWAVHGRRAPHATDLPSENEPAPSSHQHRRQTPGPSFHRCQFGQSLYSCLWFHTYPQNITDNIISNKMIGLRRGNLRDLDYFSGFCMNMSFLLRILETFLSWGNTFLSVPDTWVYKLCILFYFYLFFQIMYFKHKMLLL